MSQPTISHLAYKLANFFADPYQLDSKLNTVYETTIEGWIRALHLRNHTTEEHTQRVTTLTVGLAQMAGATEQP